MTTSDTPSQRSAVSRLLPNLGLTVLGLLITHETAYSVATWLRPLLGGDGGGHVDHGHQNLLIVAAGPLALWATAWFVLCQARRLDVTATWRATQLGSAIAGLYMAQETIEILATGPTGYGLGGLIENRAIVIGLVIIPLVARGLLRLLDQAEVLIQTWLSKPTSQPAGGAPTGSRSAAAALPAGIAHQPGDPRGPPLRHVTIIQPQIS